MRSMLVFMAGGVTYPYRALYEHGFAGMQGMRVLGGVALGSEAMHAQLQRYTFYVILKGMRSMLVFMAGGATCSY